MIDRIVMEGSSVIIVADSLLDRILLPDPRLSKAWQEWSASDASSIPIGAAALFPLGSALAIRIEWKRHEDNYLGMFRLKRIRS